MGIPTGDRITRGASSREREFASLVGELHALEEDIAAARAASARAHGGFDLHKPTKHPTAAPGGEHVSLPDGAEIVIRPVEPEDAPLLEIGLEHLSAMSRYRRFRTQVDHFSGRELEELTRVDHRTREAVGALDPQSGEGIGIARYVRDPRDPEQAEVTYVIADAWQGRKVGTALLERLAARALAVGIKRITATTLVGNEAARRLIAHIADPMGEHRDGGIIEITARLREDAG